MLYAFGFERVGVVLSDLYFVDPDPSPGQEGAERGVRLEVRLLDRPARTGSIYAANPISVGQPVWRADLLETADGPFGSFDRTHHHPRFAGWEPGRRQYDERMSADPIAFVGERLADLPGLLAGAGMDGDCVAATDADRMREAGPDILAALRRLLDRVHAGELATAPGGGPGESVRQSWL